MSYTYYIGQAEGFEVVIGVAISFFAKRSIVHSWNGRNERLLELVGTRPKYGWTNPQNISIALQRGWFYQRKSLYRPCNWQRDVTQGNFANEVSFPISQWWGSLRSLTIEEEKAGGWMSRSRLVDHMVLGFEPSGGMFFPAAKIELFICFCDFKITSTWVRKIEKAKKAIGNPVWWICLNSHLTGGTNGERYW